MDPSGGDQGNPKGQNEITLAAGNCEGGQRALGSLELDKTASPFLNISRKIYEI